MDTPQTASRHPARPGIEDPSSTLGRREAERDAVLARLRDARFHNGVFCPRCGHRSVQRWGTFSGRQRYLCNHCRRTFSDLTGTPAAYLKKIELLPAYGDCLARHLSVRRCAFRLGIHPSTAFRWRHRLLDGLRGLDTERVSGWIELGSFWLPESHKGMKSPRDPGRRAGGGEPRSPGKVGSRRRCSRWNLYYDGPRVYVAVARDRAGHLVSAASPYVTKGPLTVDVLEAALDDRIERTDPLNVTASYESRAAVRAFSVRIGGTYHASGPAGRPLAQDRAPPQVRAVVPYIRRFREWLRGFRGVATRYLANYLLWHRLIDSHATEPFQSLVLRW